MTAGRSTFLALLGLALSWTALAQAPSPMREGNWEISMKMEMPGMQMPPIKVTQCVTQAQLKDPQAAVPKGFQDGDSDCKVSEYKLSGTTATWKMMCTKPQPMTGTGEIAYAGDTYKGKVVLDMNGAVMNMSFDARRLGDCTK